MSSVHKVHKVYKVHKVHKVHKVYKVKTNFTTFLKMLIIKNITCFAKIKHAFYTGLIHLKNGFSLKSL